MTFLRMNKRYRDTADYVRTCRNLVLEIEVDGTSFFVAGQDEDNCRTRADALYGKGQWKEIVITTATEAINAHKH